MLYKIKYECADGDDQTITKDCTLEEAIDEAMEMVRVDDGDSTYTWSVTDDATGDTEASGAGDAQN